MKPNILPIDINQIKNIARGAYSLIRSLKSQKPSKNIGSKKYQIQRAQSQINSSLSLARVHLNDAQFVAFNEWIFDLFKDDFINQNRLGTEMLNLSLFPKGFNSLSLASEIRLATDRLKKLQKDIRQFLISYVDLMQNIENQNWESALSNLEVVNDRYGVSYFSLELELGIRQNLFGVESVKTKIGSMTIGVAGLHRFFLYYFGIRNEPAQTSTRFKVNLKKKVEDSDLDKSIQDYSKFRLYGHIEINNLCLSNILACETLNSTIDLFFTLGKLLRIILGNSSSFNANILSEADNAKSFFQNIFDDINNLSLNNLSFEDDIYLLNIAKASLGELLELNLGEYKTLLDMDSVGGVISKLSSRDTMVLGEELNKKLLNFNTLPIAIQLGDVSEIKSLPRYLLEMSKSFLIENSTANNIDKAVVQSLKSIAQMSDSYSNNNLNILMEAMKVSNSSESSKVLTKILDNKSINNNYVLKDSVKILIATQLNINGYLAESLAVCSDLSLENDSIVSLLPLNEIFQGVSWPSIKHLSPSIDLAINLENYYRLSNDHKIGTFKRYAVKGLLDKYNSPDVSHLLNNLITENIDPNKLEFFAYHVCDTSTLELLPGGGGTRKVMLLRKEILNTLIKLNSVRTLNYIHEERLLTEKLEVNEGMNVLDESKVFVDEQVVINSAVEDLATDFQRYLKLVQSGVGVSDELSDIIKNFNSSSAAIFQIPKNDADDLLAQILDSILEKFLLDPASGLDIIIGRRIRHGTIAGEFRGHLEKVELIGQKARAGANYEHPLLIENLLTKLDIKKRKIVSAAFSRFYDAIDQLVVLLRDEYFHVKAKNKPKGIFELGMNPFLFSLTRSIAQTCPTIEEFAKQCIEIFWFILTARTGAVRPTVEAEIKKTLNTIFSKLFKELRGVKLNEPEFFAQLQQASEELSRNAAVISSWIRVPNASLEDSRFSLQRLVDVAVATVKAQRPGFRPDISTDLSENLFLDSHGFSLAFDALYIALDNISQHSGKKIDNKTEIKIEFLKEKSLISFSVVSEIVGISGIDDKESKLNHLKAAIYKKSYGELARLDRGSGLAKLAAIVLQSKNTNISFEYSNNTHFILKFDLVYVDIGESETKKANRADSFIETLSELASAQ